MIDIQPRPRNFLPKDLEIAQWEDLTPFAKELEDRAVNDLDAYQKLLSDYNELDGVVTDDYWWRYVLLTRNTDNKEIKESFEYFTQHIQPEMDGWKDRLNKKLVASRFAKEVTETGFSIALRGLQTQIDLFREENLALKSKEEALIAQSGALRGAMSVTLDGKDVTLQEASNRLFWTDRTKREETWRLVAERQYQDKDALDKIFEGLVEIRHQIALNAGFKNYRDYMFRLYNRYDYTPQDCYDFHDSIRQHATPLLEKIQMKKAAKLGLDKLRPWDRSVDEENRAPIKAFDGVEDLLEKSTRMFGNIDPVFRDTLVLMKERGNLDLDSRKGKRPGGYMQTFLESKVPFVFANFTEQVENIITLIHEMGHAVHDILVRDLRLNLYRMYPMEVAELASMSMELLTLDQWGVYFSDKSELARAKKNLLERIVWVLPSVAQLDAFQHEIYLHPEMTVQQRHDLWNKIQKPLAGNVVDWTGLEKFEELGWQNKTHPYELPFYYVEYGMAQLGALQIWRNYKRDPKKTLEQYKQGLSLGYTKTIPEVFEACGIKFDFSAGMVKELMAFVEQELEALDKQI